MSINPDINGVRKNVVSPEVNIDGVWRAVNIVSNNIDGVWRKSYEKDKYYISLYVYGELYTVLSCKKGSSITLVSVPVTNADDTQHYGWTKTEGSATLNYQPTGKFTPTSNMELHAIFKYKTIADTISSLTENFGTDTTTGAGITVNITNAAANTAYTVTKTLRTPSQGQSISNSDSNSTVYSYFVEWTEGASTTSSGTASEDGVITFDVAGSSSSKSIGVGTVATYPGGSSNNVNQVTLYSQYVVVVSYRGYAITYGYRSSL